MRLDTAREETITNLGGAQKFKMNASAKAFQILSSGIYERKIEAIVRELSCNAYDSHVMADKVNVPFRVQLPTGLDPKFVVEDFGVGLSEDEVYNVYTTYFESTKTDSNDVIGALGLGSKTPFSYTDSFTITARKDGKECVFTASISQSGEPEVVKLYERPWSGDNGVSVSVDVASDDIREFVSCAEKVYSWFEVKPTMNREINYDIEEVVLDNIKNYGYHLQQSSSYGRRTDCKIIMGNVSYNLKLADIRSKTDEDLNSFIAQLDNMRADIFFRLNIGDADVAASRETLSLDDRTKENLRKGIKFVQENFKKNTIAKIQSMESVFEVYFSLTPYERKLVLDEKVGGYSLSDLYRKKDLPILVQDGDITQVGEDYDVAYYGNFGYRAGPRSKRQYSEKFENLVTKDLSDGKFAVTVVVNDCERKMGLKDALTNNYSLPNKILVVSDKNTKVDADLEAYISHITFGCYRIIYASTFWDGKMSQNKSKSTGLAEKTVKAHIILSGRSFSYRRMDFTDVDTSRWAYAEYAGCNDITIDGMLVFRADINEVLRELDLDGLVTYSGNNEAKVKRIIPNDLEAMVKERATKSDCEIDYVKKHLSCSVVRHTSLNVLRGFKEFCDSIQGLKAMYPKCSGVFTGRLLRREDTKRLEKIVDNRLEVFQNSLRLLGKSNTVLSHLFVGSKTDQEVEDMKEFIEFLNQKKGK